jgi:hypothetical protein
MTKISDQEKMVTAVVALFGEKEPGYLQDLLTAVDSSVHFYYFLKEEISEPIDISSGDVDYVLNTITSASTCFWQVRGATHHLLSGRQKSYRWLRFKDLGQLRKRYFVSYGKLVSKSTPLVERYLELLRLTQMQLIFAGIVF